MQKGFTLVELIIVIAIMAISIGFGFNAYTKQFQEQELNRQVDAFVSVLQSTRDRAVSRDLNHGMSCANFGGYQVRVRITADPTTTNQYRQRFICDFPPASSYRGQHSWNSLNGLEFKLSTDTFVNFYYPYGCTNISCNATDQIITIRNPRNGRCKDISINQVGNITVSQSYASGC